jgi:small subunit ribosomal protein S20
MANTKSAMKRIRTNEIRRQRNASTRSKVRTICKKFEASLTAGDPAAAQEAYRVAVSELDRAAKKGVIPRARASRKASRLAIQLNTLGA